MAGVGANTFTIDFDQAGLSNFIDQLGDAAELAIRPAAQAAAQVLYDRVKLNVQVLGRVTGNLDRAIYQAFSPENSQDGVRAQYNVSWNSREAPHGHLVEYGYLQRYKYRPDGMGPMVRPGMAGKPKPTRRSPRSYKDAYWVTLDTPRQVPGKAFVRSAASAMPQAYMAAEDELIRRIMKRGAA